MISVIIPTLNAEGSLVETLSALIPATVEGLVREVIIVDGGSKDRTLKIADQAGSVVVSSPPGRGMQLRAGADAARFTWLLFLHADTVLQPGWERETWGHIERIEGAKRADTAAAFRFALDDNGFMPRLVEWGVGLRCAILCLPYGDQGLLVSRNLYRRTGGYRDLPLMEDVDLAPRLGRSRIAILRSTAVTSAARYQRDGYMRRIARNLACLTLYYLRVPPRVITRIYG